MSRYFAVLCSFCFLTRLRTQYPLLLLVTLHACGGSASSEPQSVLVLDSAGVEIVRNLDVGPVSTRLTEKTRESA
jgi:hypothetical protein